MQKYDYICAVSTPPIMALPPSRFQWLTSIHRPDPTPWPVPVARGKTACSLICFLIEFLPPFLCLVNPCTSLWADDWRVITGCWHVCFLWASLLILFTIKAPKSFCWSISRLCSAPPPPHVCFLSFLSYLLAPQLSLFFPLTLYISPMEFKEWELCSEKKKETLDFHFKIKRKGMGPFLPFSNHFLCCSIKHGIRQCRGQIKRLYSLRTYANKTASR